MPTDVDLIHIVAELQARIAALEATSEMLLRTVMIQQQLIEDLKK